MCWCCGLVRQVDPPIESDEIVTGAPTIRRPMKAPPTPLKDGPRINREIRIPEVMLIDQDGTNRGVTPILVALQLADEAALDLVEIVPNANPPVCKILDYGKFRFLEQKKAAEARKKQKIVEIKEIKLRPGIDDHDYDVKMRRCAGFSRKGTRSSSHCVSVAVKWPTRIWAINS